MMQQWILIIAMYTPGGDYIDKTVVNFTSQRECESVKAQLPNLDHPLRVRHKGLCITRDHWTGKRYMPGVALD
jgi:hypothetical protein